MEIVTGFTNKPAAAEYIDDKPGVMGRKRKQSSQKYGDWDIMEMQIYDTIDECNIELKEELKRKVLNRLSIEERNALGFYQRRTTYD